MEFGKAYFTGMKHNKMTDETMACYNDTEVIAIKKMINAERGQKKMQSYRMPVSWIKRIAQEAKRINESMIVVIVFGLISILRYVALCAMCRCVRYQGPIMRDGSLCSIGGIGPSEVVSSACALAVWTCRIGRGWKVP